MEGKGGKVPAAAGHVSALKTLLYCISMTVWTGTALIQPVSLLVACACLPNRLAIAYLVLEVFLMFVPIPPVHTLPGFMKKIVAASCKALTDYHDFRLIYEDEDLIKADRPHIIAYEPHSVLPLAMPSTYNPNSVTCPKPLQHNTRFLVTSAVFSVPVLRHLWTWLGGCPVSRASIKELLNNGISPCVCPGGVQECLFLEAGKETVYLTKRLGFVRIAIEHGTPIIPCFVFGQTDSYHFYRPGPPLVPKAVIKWLSRNIGFAPIVFWGQWGTFLPYPSRMTMVLGKPIEVPDSQGETPDKAECQKYLDEYIAAMKAMFEKHKADAGYPDMKLVVI